MVATSHRSEKKAAQPAQEEEDIDKLDLQVDIQPIELTKKEE